MSLESTPKPVRWVASSKEDLSAFPNDVKTRVGGALWDAQIGLIIGTRLSRAKEDYEAWLKSR